MKFNFNAITRDQILNLGQMRWFWWAVFALCISLDAGALFYQHVLYYYPCELCIYVRVWLLAIALLCVVGVLLRKQRWPRFVISVGGLALSFGLANDTWNLIVVEYALSDSGSCSFFANFPSWAPLDKWLPAVFEVQELCQATPEIFLGISMAQVLSLVSISLVTAFAVVVFGAFRSLRKR